MRGVRVFELHPGGHGLHVHVVTDQYYRVEDVRAALRGTGWGRIHVTRCSSGAEYVAKYVGKARRSGELKGVRLWAAFGIPRDQRTCVRDIEVVSELGGLYDAVHGSGGEARSGENASNQFRKLCLLYKRLEPAELDQCRARSLVVVAARLMASLPNTDARLWGQLLERVNAMRLEAIGLGGSWESEFDPEAIAFSEVGKGAA